MLTMSKMNLEAKGKEKEYVRQYDHAPLVSMGYKVPTEKTHFDEDAGCDVYSASGNYHFRTSMASGVSKSVGFSSYDDALTMIEAMIKLGVPGIWHVAKSLEDGKFYVMPTKTYNPKK